MSELGKETILSICAGRKTSLSFLVLKIILINIYTIRNNKNGPLNSWIVEDLSECKR